MHLAELLAVQSGVVSRGQLATAGLADHDVRRLLRRRELTRIHPGVYVDHTGAPTWLQAAWAAVLVAGSAALAGQSALRAIEGPGGREALPVHVIVPWEHRRRPVEGVRIERRRGFDDLVLHQAHPPRMRYDDAVLDVAQVARTDLIALEEVSRAVQGRRTTARRLAAALEARARVRRRAWLTAVLLDVAAGTCSVLEHGYLTKVERPHGLPRAGRQVRDRVGAGAVYRDVEYAAGLVVELDGRLHHDTTRARDRDMDRDLETAARGHTTVRLSYGQVFDRPCSTAERIGRLLAARGWRSGVCPCPDCPAPGKFAVTW